MRATDKLFDRRPTHPGSVLGVLNQRPLSSALLHQTLFPRPIHSKQPGAKTKS